MALLTVKEVSQRLKVSQGCVYQLIAERRLPHFRIGLGRGCIRVRDEDLQKFIESCHVDEFSLCSDRLP